MFIATLKVPFTFSNELYYSSEGKIWHFLKFNMTWEQTDTNRVQSRGPWPRRAVCRHWGCSRPPGFQPQRGTRRCCPRPGPWLGRRCRARCPRWYVTRGQTGSHDAQPECGTSECEITVLNVSIKHNLNSNLVFPGSNSLDWNKFEYIL